MIDVQWDGQTLRVHGKNKAARIALNGQDHDDDVIIPRERIAKVELRTPKLMGSINGCLTVTTTLGTKHRLNFRAKTADEFKALAAELQTAAQPS